VQWQALDCGVVFARRWYWNLVAIWLITSFPVFCILSLVFYKNPSLAALVVWWLKPLWERPMLFIVSREIFNQELSILDTLKQFKQYLQPDLIMPLTLRRFATTRSYNMPIAVLEKLAGKPRSDRASVVNRRFSNTAFWSLVTCVHIELFLMFGFAAGVFFLIPQSVTIDWEFWLMNQEAVLTHIYNNVWYLAATLVAPVYVCSGFALYMQRRIDLEAWDIEILFRKLYHRRQRIRARTAASALVLFCATSMVWLAPDNAHAESAAAQGQASERVLSHEHAEINAQIREIYQSESFSNYEHKSGFRRIPQDEKSETATPEALISFLEWLEARGDFFKGVANFLSFVAKFIEVILWSIFIGLGVYVFVQYRKQLKALWDRLTSPPEKSEPQAPKVMFGLEVTEESLPDDVVAVAIQEWRDGLHRSAMALLLRASIVELIQYDQCRFFDGNTEAECVDIAHLKLGDDAKVKVFTSLVKYWQIIAYAHREIDGFSFENFCLTWGESFRGA